MHKFMYYLFFLRAVCKCIKIEGLAVLETEGPSVKLQSRFYFSSYIILGIIWKNGGARMLLQMAKNSVQHSFQTLSTQNEPCC